MDLPFYTHHTKRKDISEEDKAVLRDLMRVTEPTFVYAAGKYLKYSRWSIWSSWDSSKVLVDYTISSKGINRKS